MKVQWNRKVYPKMNVGIYKDLIWDKVDVNNQWDDFF